MSWNRVEDYRHPSGWANGDSVAERAASYCQQLEQGKILFFSEPPFDLPPKHREFLLAQRRTDTAIHKNISYRPHEDVLRGFASDSAEVASQLQTIMREYSKQVTQFLSRFLPPYAKHWKLDFASYRPFEEEGRELPLHKRNDLLHTDAFPNRPTHGARILRVFTNINPSQPRIWDVTDPFHVLAPRFAEDAGLKGIASNTSSPAHGLLRQVKRLGRAVGIPVVDRSAYDAFMLRFHDYLKENTKYQTEYPRTRLEFPPYSTWIVFTDSVPHAALSGRFALEQTYIVPTEALLTPDKSPIRVLEALCGQSLAV